MSQPLISRGVPERVVAAMPKWFEWHTLPIPTHVCGLSIAIHWYGPLQDRPVLAVPYSSAVFIAPVLSCVGD